MNKLIMLPLVAGAMFWSCGCSMPEENKKDDGKPSEEQTPPVEDKDLAKTWTTSFDKSYDLKTASLEYGKAASMSPKIVRFTDETYQTVDGFGLAVTQASCYNLLKMSADDRTKVLKELFSPTEGAGSSLIRVSRPVLSLSCMLSLLSSARAIPSLSVMVIRISRTSSWPCWLRRWASVSLLSSKSLTNWKSLPRRRRSWVSNPISASASSWHLAVVANGKKVVATPRSSD